MHLFPQDACKLATIATANLFNKFIPSKMF